MAAAQDDLQPLPTTEQAEHENHGNHHLDLHLPFHHHPGESGRKGIHPFHFLAICFRSSCHYSMAVNVLWPLVPAAIAVHFAVPEKHLLIFILNYLAMIPAANTIGFAGQELARKLPKVLGVLTETTLGSLVEMVLFIVFVVKGERNVPIVKAAILGSILANLLLCLGICFIAGSLRGEDQEYHDSISETGSGLMLVAGMALVIPAAFSTVAVNAKLTPEGDPVDPTIDNAIVSISRATAILLLVAYGVYICFQMLSHHSLMTEVLEADEEKDRDRERDAAKRKLTLTESIFALVISIACVTMIAVFLVHEIPYIVEERGISDAFMGLILVPLVEKAAEHLTAVDEAWDGQSNFALAHVLGASVQTALLNTPLVVFVGWGLGVGMDLNFTPFDSIALILAILVVGNFLRDRKSNYLEGSLCVIVYVIIAVCAFYYPNPSETPSGSSGSGTG